MFLLANILIVTKSASRFAEFYQICWQKCGGPVFLLGDLWTLTKFTGQFTDCHQLQEDLLTFTISAGRNGGISASIVTDCHQMCQQRCRGYFCHQIYWLSPNLLADLLTFTKSAGRNGGISESKFTDCYQICWQRWGFISARNFTVSKSTGRFTDFHTNSCGRFPDFNTRSASRLTDSPNLLEDLLTLTLNLPA